jgi:septin family protein
MATSAVSAPSSSTFKVIDEHLDRASWEALYLRHPFNILIAGPSGSGKTEFVKRLIEHKHLFVRSSISTDRVVLQRVAIGVQPSTRKSR